MGIPWKACSPCKLLQAPQVKQHHQLEPKDIIKLDMSNGIGILIISHPQNAIKKYISPIGIKQIIIHWKLHMGLKQDGFQSHFLVPEFWNILPFVHAATLDLKEPLLASSLLPQRVNPQFLNAKAPSNDQSLICGII